MAYDLALIERYEQKYRRLGSTIYVDTIDTNSNAVVDTLEFINASVGGPLPEDVLVYAKARLMEIITGSELTLLQSANAISVTGTTSEVIVAKKTIDANFLQDGDLICVKFIGSNNNSANNKTYSVRLGSIELYTNSVTTNTTNVQELNFYVRALENTVVGGNQYGGPSYGNGYAGSIPVVAVFSDVKAARAIDIRLTLANAADTITLNAFSISVKRAGAGANEA